MAPFKSSLARSAGKLFGVLKERDLSLRGATQSTRFVSGFSASGGNVDALSPGNGYKYHTFTSSGAFTLVGASQKTFEMLLVAGGGAGGARNDGGSDGGGGGGAGGLIYVPGVTLADGTYNVTIGNGGTAKPADNNAAATSVMLGGDTTFVLSGPSAHITAKGGGGGGSGPVGGPLGTYGNGGSGGGAGSGGSSQPTYYGDVVSQPVTLLSAPQYDAFGFRGGDGDSSTPHAGSGGGGAAERGVNGRNQPNGGAGGAGRQYPDFTGPLIGVPALNPLSGYYAGGGAGGSGGPGNNPGTGSANGGGGASGPSGSEPLNGGPGFTNSGGGAAGGSGFTSSNPGGPGIGGAGGSGILIIRYQ
jgi:hypothetical protein